MEKLTNDKVRIEITGEVQKEKDEKFTAIEREKFNNDFIQWIENKGLVFIGMLE